MNFNISQSRLYDAIDFFMDKCPNVGMSVRIDKDTLKSSLLIETFSSPTPWFIKSSTFFVSLWYETRSDHLSYSS